VVGTLPLLAIDDPTAVVRGFNLPTSE